MPAMVTIGPPTMAPTPLPTPPPTPMPTVVEVFRSCALLDGGVRLLWSVYGTARTNNVRLRIEGVTSGWLGVGFYDGECASSGNSTCMSGADLVVATRPSTTVGWRLDSYRRNAIGNGQPSTFAHGVVEGIAGDVEIGGAPEEPTTHMTFFRKVQAADNFVRLRVDPSQGSTTQTILYAWGDDDQRTLQYHTQARRGTRVVDWAVDTEECGRPPQVSSRSATRTAWF